MRLEHSRDWRDARALIEWAETKGEDNLEAYRLSNNVVSIDGLSTGYVSNDF